MFLQKLIYMMQSSLLAGRTGISATDYQNPADAVGSERVDRRSSHIGVMVFDLDMRAQQALPRRCAV